MWCSDRPCGTTALGCSPIYAAVGGKSRTPTGGDTGVIQSYAAASPVPPFDRDSISYWHELKRVRSTSRERVLRGNTDAFWP